MPHGELAALRLIPHTPYYGTADATPLYLVVLSEAYQWTGDLEMVRHYRPVAERCLDWIDRYGDLDAEWVAGVCPRMPTGYHNQGWKDAGDAVVYPDGTQVPAPIGTCELQAHVYEAKRRMADLFGVLGERQRAAQLRDQAAAVKGRFNDVFWMAPSAPATRPTIRSPISSARCGRTTMRGSPPASPLRLSSRGEPGGEGDL